MTEPTTRLIHHPYRAPEGFEAPQRGVFKASTIFFKNVEALRSQDWRHKTGYVYGLHGTPTSFELEARLCELEGGKQCLLTPSGLSAIGLVSLALLKTGDEVLLPDNAYGPNLSLAQGELARWGITHRLYDALDAADLAAKLTERTALVWIEAAGSVSMEFPDVVALVAACRARGVRTALDNTWGAGLAFAPFETGVDISMHALTKYPSGGGDVLLGSVITRDEALHQRLRATHMRLGFGVGMNDVELVLRSLPTMALRYRAQDETARRLATWLAERPEVAQVLHPALPGAPGHTHWRALCAPRGDSGLAAGLFSLILHERYSSAEVDAFCDRLRLFKLGFSWGGPISLVVPYNLAAMRGGWPRHLTPGSLVRLSTGLESVADLRADLAQALAGLPPR
jgi:cysteine-S-conjugate beta-lyase